MNSTENQGNKPAEDLLEDLFRQASPRARPPQDAEQAARAALHAQWRDLTARRRRRRRYWPLAAAASVVVATGFALLTLRGTETTSPAVTLATVETVVGGVLVEGADGSEAVPLAGSPHLMSGGTVRTRSDAGLGLRWRDGSSVRLDRNTVARLTAAGEVRLETGRVYVDAEDSSDAGAPVVATPAGRVRHLGTQYMTAVNAAATTVSVRRGRVRLDGPGAIEEAGAGEQLQVDSSGAARVQAISTYGNLWLWTQATAPGFDAEGRSVADFLDWVSRESGHPIAFASPSVRQSAQSTRLRGRIDLDPMTALPGILEASDLAYDIRDGSLYIRRTGAR
jgi:ferric-dicitrate binding protein FerR (iron transport regulator)